MKIEYYDITNPDSHFKNMDSSLLSNSRLEMLWLHYLLTVEPLSRFIAYWAHLLFLLFRCFPVIKICKFFAVSCVIIIKMSSNLETRTRSVGRKHRRGLTTSPTSNGRRGWRGTRLVLRSPSSIRTTTSKRARWLSATATTIVNPPCTPGDRIRVEDRCRSTPRCCNGVQKGRRFRSIQGDSWSLVHCRTWRSRFGYWSDFNCWWWVVGLPTIGCNSGCKSRVGISDPLHEIEEICSGCVDGCCVKGEGIEGRGCGEGLRWLGLRCVATGLVVDCTGLGMIYFQAT